MKMKRTLTLVAMLVSLALLAAPAKAWIITQTEPAPGAGLAESLVILFDWDPDADLYEIHKYFLFDKQPLVLQFTREVGDKDTIKIVDEIILNMFTVEQLSWMDYHVALEKDPTSGKDVIFVDPAQATAWQNSGGETRLDGVPFAAGATEIVWYTEDPGQNVPYGDFSDAPYNQLVLRGLTVDVSQLEVGDSFRLKQWPTVPEPTVVSLLAASVALLSLKRHGRRG